MFRGLLDKKLADGWPSTFKKLCCGPKDLMEPMMAARDFKKAFDADWKFQVQPDPLCGDWSVERCSRVSVPGLLPTVPFSFRPLRCPPL